MKNFSSEMKHLELHVCLAGPTIKSLSYIPLVLNVTLNIFLCITAALGNFLILLTIGRNQSLRSSPSTILLSGLALSDLCVGLISEPVYITLQVLVIVNGDAPCAIGVASFLLNCYLSGLTLLNLTAISVDRYLAILLHLRYQEIVTEKRVKILVLGLWITVALSLILSPWQLLKWLASFVGILCSGIVLFSWIRIYQVVRHHQTQIQGQMEIQGEHLNMGRLIKSAINTMFILLVFIVCYFPTNVSLVTFAFHKDTSNVQAIIYTYNLVLLNSSINPLVYCWRRRDIRLAVKQTLAKLYCF